MSLQKYIALLKTVELGSISQAAEQMGYTQPAVSRMISDLEHEWNVELLRRSRAGLEVSSVCQRLLPILRSIAADCEELDYTIGEIHGMRTGLVRVGTFTSVSDMWIPGLLMSFQQMYPHIEFELLNSEDYVEIEEWIKHGKVDCGFVSMPTANDLQTYFLKRDMLVAVLPLNHPMTTEPIFPISRLEGEPFIKLKENVDYEISRFLDQLPFQPSLRFASVGQSEHPLPPLPSVNGSASAHPVWLPSPDAFLRHTLLFLSAWPPDALLLRLTEALPHRKPPLPDPQAFV